MKKVFIIGTARTGSKIYKNLLSNYSDINISGEIHLLEPAWLRKDLKGIIKKKVGSLESDSNVNQLLELLYSGEPGFTFFRNESEIGSINKERLKEAILRSNRYYKGLLTVLLEEHAKAKNKKRAGAKFPVNIVYAEKLLEWYPDAKIIHLTRDPRAIYPSMQRNILKITQSYNKSFVKLGFLIKIFTMSYLVHQYKYSARFFQKHNTMDNYYLSRFEDIVSKPEEHIRKLCSFLGINFKEELLYPPVSDSSFKAETQVEGFNKHAIERWKNHISPFTEKLIILSLNKEMQLFGYI